MRRWRIVSAIVLVFWSRSDISVLGQTGDIQALLRKAEAAAANGQLMRAIELATKVIEQDATSAAGYYLRGRARFRAGQVSESASDFDRVIQLQPARRNRLWERGISCYYAGRYKDGADQFSAYQQFDDSDVENAVWHVLCLSRLQGFAAAQRQMMRVKQDRRIPMHQIDQLFRGRGSVDAVINAVQWADLSAEQRHTANFYAHLYIGLFHEANGDKVAARDSIRAAVRQFPIGHYMGDVARVHYARLDAATGENR